MPPVTPLSVVQCRRLLIADVVGRIGLTTPDGPVVLPVNYSIVDEAVILRTALGGLLHRYAPGQQVAFEVDHVDHDDHRGWSVLATGTASCVEDPAAIDAIRHSWDPRPWAQAVDRQVYLRIPWRTLTGRRVGGGWTAENEVEVRRHL